MCGICGIVHCDAPPPEDGTIRAMMDALAHRGPDAEGTWGDHFVTLGHTRLSIIDLDARSNQPMIDGLGRVIVFNGEMYNYRDLRAELEHRYAFRTESDTEVVLAAYDAWGEDCVRRFNGDWALAIYDPSAREVFLSRDRVGVKPLYWAFHGGRFVFASEVRALAAAGVAGAVPRRRLITFIVRGENEPGQWTMLRDVEALLPGCSMTVRADGSYAMTRYWSESDVFSAEVEPDFEAAVDQYAEVFEDSVRLRLHADVPVGVCLSGGVDSSLIAAVASRLSEHPVATFSGVAPGFESDEGPFSDAVAAHCGDEPHADRVAV